MNEGTRFMLLEGPATDGPPVQQPGIERRFAKRVRVEIPGLIDVSGRLHQVRFTDISRTGFAVVVPGEPKVGLDVYFFLGDRVEGRGKIANVCPQGARSKVGCTVSAKLYPQMDSLVKAMLEGQAGGCVSRSECGTKLIVEGHLGFAQWRDMTMCRGVHTVCVRSVTRIDSAGIGLLLAKIREGARLEGCSAELSRFMRSINACVKCNPECEQGQADLAAPERTAAAGSL